MRLVRFVRLARAFRVLRVMTSFSKLRILLRTTASSFASLFWAMVLMFLFMYGSAMSLCQALHLPQELRVLTVRLWMHRVVRDSVACGGALKVIGTVVGTKQTAAASDPLWVDPKRSAPGTLYWGSIMGSPMAD